MTKQALVWGASGGIGRAMVAHLMAQGWTVVAVSRHTDTLEDLTEHVIEADVTDDYEVQLAVSQASHTIDEIDLFVYAAGDITSVKLADMAHDDWQRIINANLTGAYLATHHSMPLLAPDAHLFFLGAISERLKLPGLAAYAAAKSALEVFGEVLAKEQRKRRITVVRPGAVDTPLWDKMPLKLPPKAFSPADIAQKILVAFEQKHKGSLDLIP